MKLVEIYYKNLKKNYVNFFVIFFIWSSLFLSLNTNFVSIIEFLEDLNLINFLRARSVLLFFSLILILIFFLKNKITFKKNFFYILLLSLLIIQSRYFFSNEFDLINKISYENIYENNLFKYRYFGIQLQSIQLFISILLSLLIFLIFDKEENKHVFIFTFTIFIFIFFLFYFSLYILSLPKHLNSPNVLLYFNEFFAHEATLIKGEPAIRITGVGRSLVIISIIFFCIFQLFNRNNFIKYFLIFFLIFLNFSIIMTGSRFASYSYILTYFFLIFFLKYSFKQKISYIMIFIIIPILLFFLSLGPIKNYQESYQLKLADEKLAKNNLANNNLDKKDLNNNIQSNDLINNLSNIKDTRYFNDIASTTGRMEIWKNAIIVAKEKGEYLLGNGINADRRYLLKYGNKFGTNASSGIINIYITSGIVGLIIFITANFIIVLNIFRFIFFDKCFQNFNKYYLINISILIIFIFYQRLIFENSITSFGLDYLIYLVASYFILNNIKSFNLK